jgi:HEAT repeats
LAIPHLVKAFYQNENWLVRRSILACLTELESDRELFEVCVEALKDEDLTVQETAIDAMKTLKGSEQHQNVLKQLLKQVTSDSWRIRIRVAHALRLFSEPEAQQALEALKQDSDHRVVAATLESMV